MKVKDLMTVLEPLGEILGDYDISYKPPTGLTNRIDAICIDSTTQEVRLL